VKWCLPFQQSEQEIVLTNITFFRMVYQFSMRTITKNVIITKQEAEECKVLPLFVAAFRTFQRELSPDRNVLP